MEGTWLSDRLIAMFYGWWRKRLVDMPSFRLCRARVFLIHERQRLEVNDTFLLTFKLGLFQIQTVRTVSFYRPSYAESPSCRVFDAVPSGRILPRAGGSPLRHGMDIRRAGRDGNPCL